MLQNRYYLEAIKNYLSSKEVKEVFSEKELENIDKDITRKISKAKAAQVANINKKVETAFNTVGTKPETQKVKTPLFTEDGTLNEEAFTDLKDKLELIEEQHFEHPDIKSKRADIERRRQEALNTYFSLKSLEEAANKLFKTKWGFHPETTTLALYNKHTGDSVEDLKYLNRKDADKIIMSAKHPDDYGYVKDKDLISRLKKEAFSISDVEINAKYDAELAALSSEDNSGIVEDVRDVNKINASNKKAPLTRSSLDKFDLVKEVDIFGDANEGPEAKISQEAKDFNMESSTKKMREACKALAEDYLEEYPDYTLQDFFQSLLGEKTLNKKVIEEDFYYLSNGFYEAKGQNLEDAENKNEAKELYRLLFVVPKRLARIQGYLNSREISEELPVTEEEKKEEEEKFEAVTETELKEKTGDVVGVDENGLPVKYRGDRIAKASIKVPFMGIFYKVILVDGEYVFERDFEAEAEWALKATADELNRRAFLLNPETAREGVKLKVYIPTGEKLMNSKVVKWVKMPDGFLHNQIITFREWLDIEEFEDVIDMDGNLVLDSDSNPKKIKVDKSEGSQAWIEKVPVLMRGNIHGQELELGNALHEVDWWSERNVADFLKFKDLSKMSESEKTTTIAEARLQQQATINEGKELTRGMRSKVWDTVKDSFKQQEEPVIEFSIKNVTNGRSL